MNVTLTETRQAGYVQVLPSGSTAFGRSSNLNVTGSGRTAVNLVTVPLGPDGAVVLNDVAGGHLIADVVGYYAPAATSSAGRHVGVSPVRAVDTRDGSGTGFRRPLRAGEVLTIPLAGRFGVPATGASAVSLSLTVTQSDSAGFVQVVPSGGITPLRTTSNVNVTGPGQTVANMVVVPLGSDGAVQLYAEMSSHVLVDVVGFVTDASAPTSSDGLFVPLAPARVLDTRTTGRLQGTRDVALRGLEGVPERGVAAVVVNATVVDTTGPGYLQLFPARRGVPGASSNVNATGPGQTVAAAATAALGVGGLVSLHAPTSTHAVLDVVGYLVGDPVGAGDHSMAGWGSDEYGQLGRGVRTPWSTTLAPAAPGGDWASVSAGWDMSMGIRSDGTLWAWGDNTYGQLATGSAGYHASPLQVGTSRDWVEVVTSGGSTVALRADGTLWGWGGDRRNASVDGGPVTPAVPAPIATDRRWTTVATGRHTILAIATDGGLWGWGTDYSGVLGTTTHSAVPVPIDVEHTWAAVAVGEDHALGITTDGRLWSWGSDVWGERGDGWERHDGVLGGPRLVPSDERWATVAASTATSFAITRSGELFAWGLNSFTPLGTADVFPKDVPTPVVGFAGWRSVATGSAGTVGIRTDGTLWAWGQGIHLPDGTFDPVLTPRQVGEAADWRSATVSERHVLALRD